MIPKKEIGERWVETLARVEALLVVEHAMEYDDRKFLNDMKHRLIQYETRTFVTAKQLNYISHLERTFMEDHRGHG